MHLASAGGWPGRLDVDQIKTTVRSWFVADALDALFESNGSETERIALAWLTGRGKRWRPILAACAYEALGTSADGNADALKRVAVAVECFHKASLIHDDIEDGDQYRDGTPTVHQQYGTPIAINVGDFLLGQGYRLIGMATVPAEQRARMLSAASEGHRSLCLGQGDELCWVRNRRPLSSSDVLRIFRLKTSPAFEVALRLGALARGADEETCAVLSRYSEALGIAYQIRDDLQDSAPAAAGNDLRAMRPSLLLALAYEAAEGVARQSLAEAWTHGDGEHNVRSGAEFAQAEARARQLLEHYRNQAIRSLSPLRNVRFKSVLQQIVGRILNG
jgi:geranylgeranyl pyrophosphate synthase